MSSKKSDVVRLEVPVLTIPPKPRARSRQKNILRIEVIEPKNIQSAVISQPLKPKLMTQRRATWFETIETSVSVPSIVRPPITAGVPREGIPMEARPVEDAHIRVIRPTNINQAEQVIKESFETISGDVVAILTYIDDSTFAYLDFIPKSVSIRVLTSVIDKKDEAKRAAILQKRSRNNLDIFKLTFIEGDKEKPLLHERWLSDGKTFIDFGTDLKTSALGAKQHTITIDPAGKRKNQLDNFEWYWKADCEKLGQIFNKKVLKEVFFS